MMWFTDGFPELYSGELIEKMLSGGTGGGGSSEWGSITGNILTQSDLQNQMNTKADQSTMTTTLQGKVDVSTYTTDMSNKVDTTTFNNGLNSRVDFTTYNTGIGAKADKTYVDNGLSLKADTTTVNNLSTQLSNKADVSSLATKLDIVGGTITGNLKVTGTNESSTLTKTDSNVGGSTTLMLRNSSDDAYIRAYSSPSQNYLVSSNYANTTSKNMTIGGNSANNMNTLTLKADTTTANGIINGTTLQEGGTNLSSKYLLQSGGSLSGALTVNSGASAVIQKMSNNNGTTAYIGSSGKNSLQSGNSAFTGVQNLNIEGYNGLNIPTLNLNADNTVANGVLNATTLQQGGTPINNLFASKTSDIPYTTLTLQNGATVNNSRTPRYARINGTVFLQGEIANITANTVIGTLPVGCRPSIVMNFVCPIATSSAMQTVLVSIGVNGTINMLVQTSGATGGMCLNLSFLAEQ